MQDNFLPLHPEDGVGYAGYQLSAGVRTPVVARLLDGQWDVRCGRGDVGEWVPARADQRLVVSLSGQRTLGGGLIVPGEYVRLFVSVFTKLASFVGCRS